MLMKFNTRIKYKGNYYEGLEPVEIDEADVQEMQKFGGVQLIECQTEKVCGQECEQHCEPQKNKGKKRAAGEA